MATPHLGEVAPNGGVYFHHEDINECRAFLRDHGLKIGSGYQGWISDSGDLRGILDFSRGTHYAAYWRAE